MFNLRNNLFVIILLIVTTHYGCKEKNNPLIPQPEYFDIEYWFVNHGDTAINAVEILSITWYPKENRGWARQHNFQTPGAFDTLRDTAETKGYYGCITQMGIYINKLWDQDTIPCWRFYYFEGNDTINTYEKRIRVFNWPVDTAIAIHEYLNRIGFCKP